MFANDLSWHHQYSEVARILSTCDQINFRANERITKLVRAMPSAAENHEINRIGYMPKFSINECNEKLFKLPNAENLFNS